MVTGEGVLNFRLKREASLHTANTQLDATVLHYTLASIKAHKYKQRLFVYDNYKVNIFKIDYFLTKKRMCHLTELAMVLECSEARLQD